MDLDHELKTVFQQESTNWIAPTNLKGKILNRVESKQDSRRVKKWVMASILAATLLIPTGALAGYNYIADSIYGSQENIVHMGGTPQKYAELEAKLEFAKQHLNEEEFEKWMSLLKELGVYNLKIMDTNGVPHLDKLNADEQKAYKKLTADLEPIFNQLNQLNSDSKKTSSTNHFKSANINMFWNDQLNKAEKIFNYAELSQFRIGINELKAYDTKTIDQDGEIHYERLSKEDEKNIERVIQQLQPYFKKLGITMKPNF